jgi:hypothetical protein
VIHTSGLHTTATVHTNKTNCKFTPKIELTRCETSFRSFETGSLEQFIRGQMFLSIISNDVAILDVVSALACLGSMVDKYPRRQVYGLKLFDEAYDRLYALDVLPCGSNL